MSDSTAGGTCANVEGTPCSNPASKTCSRCYLVQYCNKECQRSHWPSHKIDCKSPFLKESWKPAWDVEDRPPTFMESANETTFSPGVPHGVKKYLWGNVPALDILNPKDNEEVDVPSPLPSGDLRNVVKTLAQLPQSYAGQCEAVINDRDVDIVARNAIMLLTAISCPTDIASEAMLHMWYSAFITSDIFKLLQEKVKPLIDEVCEKIRNKPENVLQSKSWTVGNGTLCLILKEIWNALQAYFDILAELSKSKAQEIMVATTLAPARKDYVERFLSSRPLGWRVGAIKFRKGRTIFQSRDFWPMMDSANPLEGWAIEDIMGMAPVAKNDLYGGLYHLVKGFLLQFCDGIALRPTRFQLLYVDAAELPGVLTVVGKDQQHSFDRIEVSNIVDESYLGTAKTISTFAPLLQPKSLNPDAAILTLYLNAVHEIDPKCGDGQLTN
ncbi:hypothetical protein N431DRAFT_473171 [Stipitochalara longipes BDJ]|nr:hypothetical protein N431DRAFT_473171 [Stipitochalara longipes BDJ]